MAGGHSHPDETNQTQQPLRSLPTNLLMGSLKNHLMADGTIGNLTVTGKLQVTGATSSIAVGATPPTAANAGTGIWLDRTGLYSLLSNTYQVKIDATDGKLYAGAGAITLDAGGLAITCQAALSSPASVRFVGAIDGVLFGMVRANSTATENNIRMELQQIDGKDAGVGVFSRTDSSHLAITAVRAISELQDISIVISSQTSPSIAVVRINGAPLYVADGTITGTQLISNIATGTKPLDVTSTTVCTNLNAQLWNGQAQTGATSIIMADGGTIGQAAGPLVTFDDTNNFLEITGCSVGVSIAAPADALHVYGHIQVRYGYRIGSTTGGAGVSISPNAGLEGYYIPFDGSGNAYIVNTYTGAGNGKIFLQTSATTRVTIDKDGNVTLGNASTQTITCTGRLIPRTTASDPQHATPASRPAGTVGEIAYYGGKWYGCTNAATPTWEKITSA